LSAYIYLFNYTCMRVSLRVDRRMAHKHVCVVTFSRLQWW
jgi:hypothetical protein